MDNATAISILTPPPGDESVRLLDTIFGVGWQNILGGGTPPEATGALYSMLQIFNSVVLAGVVVLMLYVLCVGVVGTAHEGKPLGKRYSTLWTPIRGAFSVGLLIPLPWAKGLSMIQAALLLCTYYGIGGADRVFSAVTQYMQAHGGQVTVLQPPVEQVEALARGVIELETARAVLAREVPVPGYSINWDAAGQKYVISTAPVLGLTPEELGMIDIPCPGGATSPLCEAQKSAVITMIVDLRQQAQALASNYEGGANRDPDSAAIANAIRKYIDTVNAGVIDEAAAAQEGYTSGLEKWVRGAEEAGWLSAGQWYWTIAHYNEKVGAAATAAPIVTPPNREALSVKSSGETDIYLPAAGRYADLSLPQRQELARGPMQADGRMGAVMSWFSRPFAMLPDPGSVLTEGDPAANLQRAGRLMIDAGLVAGAGISSARIASAAAENAADNSTWAGLVPGLKEGVGAAAGAAKEAAKIAWEGAQWIIIPLILLGISLAYYLPAVPFILWSLAVIGWLILVLESIIAAPLWAAAHAIPEGEGLAGERGKQGYMLVLSVLMRPALMIFGILLSYILMRAVMELIGRGFSVFAAGMQAGAVSGPISYLVLYAIMGGLCIAAAHKLFGLITWLPDNVLRWVGQQVQSLGEPQGEQHTRAMLAGASSRVEHGIRPSAGGGGNKGGEKAHAAARKTETDEVDQTTLALMPGESPGRST